MTYSLTARLAPRSGTSALLRIVSILNGRCANVRRLTFDTEHAVGAVGAVVTAQVTLTNAGLATLQESLRRPIEVLEVSADQAPV